MLGVVLASLIRSACARATVGARFAPRPARPPSAVPLAMPPVAFRKLRRDTSIAVAERKRCAGQSPRAPHGHGPCRLGRWRCDMKRFAVLIMAGVVLGTIATGPAGAADTRHSGRVLEVDPTARTLRIEEMKAWTGPGTGTVELALRLTPGAPVFLVARAPGVGPAGWPNAWQEERITLDVLQPGDFVTVTTGERGD